MNILLVELNPSDKIVEIFEEGFADEGMVYTSEASSAVPVLNYKQQHFIIPKPDSDTYLHHLLRLCRINEIDAIIAFGLADLKLISSHQAQFYRIGAYPLMTLPQYSKLLLNRKSLWHFLHNKNFNVKQTFTSWDAFDKAYRQSQIELPVNLVSIEADDNVRPLEVSSLKELKALFEPEKYLIQEIISGQEFIIDAYVDQQSKRPVSIYIQQLLTDSSGEVHKTISIKDYFTFIRVFQFIKLGHLRGILHLKLLYYNDKHYITEVKPGFSPYYFNAHGKHINFVEFVRRNLHEVENKDQIGAYPENKVVSMKEKDVIGR